MIIFMSFVILFFCFTFMAEASGDHRASLFFQKLFCISIFFLMVGVVCNSGLI